MRSGRRSRGPLLPLEPDASVRGLGSCRGMRSYCIAPGRCRGQMLIPSLFVLPSLFLFVFLIFETAKLSREKIRHQFAVDSAAFVEMTNYADFLNRSAYVNGAFPMRIFKEAFKDIMVNRSAGDGSDSIYTILYGNGIFPSSDQGDPTDSPPLDPQPVWNIKFGGFGEGKNKNPPDMDSTVDTDMPKGEQPAQLVIIRLTNLNGSNGHTIFWDDAQEIYKLYVQVYQLLGSVEDAQWSVLKRLAAQHTFFGKSYWLNTGDNINDASEGASYFNRSFNPKPFCVRDVNVYGDQPTLADPFQLYKQVHSPTPISMSNNAMANCSPPGLFHLMTIPDRELAAMNQTSNLSDYRGYPVAQHWTAPTNYFKVDFNSLMGGQRFCPGGDGRPCVHSTIALINLLTSPGGGSLWPNPTPKFQTRLHP